MSTHVKKIVLYDSSCTANSIKYWDYIFSHFKNAQRINTARKEFHCSTLTMLLCGSVPCRQKRDEERSVCISLYMFHAETEIQLKYLISFSRKWQQWESSWSSKRVFVRLSVYRTNALGIFKIYRQKKFGVSYSGRIIFIRIHFHTQFPWNDALRCNCCCCYLMPYFYFFCLILCTVARTQQQTQI